MQQQHTNKQTTKQKKVKNEVHFYAWRPRQSGAHGDIDMRQPMDKPM